MSINSIAVLLQQCTYLPKSTFKLLLNAKAGNTNEWVALRSFLVFNREKHLRIHNQTGEVLPYTESKCMLYEFLYKIVRKEEQLLNIILFQAQLDLDAIVTCKTLIRNQHHLIFNLYVTFYVHACIHVMHVQLTFASYFECTCLHINTY